MGVENIMYFGLGLLVAGLLALMIMPAIWRRAVRLTRKRIEAATPITMAEFRADKDQLRAEFALSTRRLEMNVEALRIRLAEQLREINRRKGDLNAVKTDRDTHLTIIRELEEREVELRNRVVELEKEGANLALKLRARDRDYAGKVEELEAVRQALRDAEPTPAEFDGERLSGQYTADVDRLIELIRIERTRMAFLEEQNRGLISQLENTTRRTAETAAAADEMRRALAEREDAKSASHDELVAAEAHIADAESRLTVALAETARVVADGEAQTERLLAEKLGVEEQLAHLRAKIENVESTVMADWQTERMEQAHLRERLNDIASDVARLVYAVDGSEPTETSESLLAVVQRFADDGSKVEQFPVRTSPRSRPAGPRPVHGAGIVSDRLAALRDIHSNG